MSESGSTERTASAAGQTNEDHRGQVQAVFVVQADDAGYKVLALALRAASHSMRSFRCAVGAGIGPAGIDGVE
jgi:hypothetical protein